MRGGVNYKKREIEPDPIYGSALVAKFTNNLMMSGKKTTAQRAVYGAFDLIKAQGADPLEVFQKAIENVGPKVEVKAKRIGGAAYQVPQEVREGRRISLAIRWILDAMRKRSNAEYKTLSGKLAAELLDASKNLGDAIKKKDVAHRMAEANRAFGHFRF